MQRVEKSVLNNLTQKYLDEEKTKAKDKFTFIFQSEKDEDINVKQLQTAKVYHVIDEPQFNDNEAIQSKGHSRLNSGLEHTIQGIKKYSTKGGSLHDRQFQKNQQTSEQQIQRQIQFEKKGREIRENMVQKKKDKVTQMKNNSENKFKQQEDIAQSVIDIHKKGHLVYVDYGEEKRLGQNGIKEYQTSPKNTDLDAIAYSKIIEKTQEFLDQEEVYKQIKKDLQFKFNFATDKNENSNQNQNESSPNRQKRTISPAHKNEKKDYSNNIISLVENDINVNLTKDEKKKIDKNLFKYLKSESTNYLIERDNIGSPEKIQKQREEGGMIKPPSKPPKILKNSHSVKQGKLLEQSTSFLLKDNSSIIKLVDEQNTFSKDVSFVDQPKNHFEVCKTEQNERSKVKLPLRNTRSQLANTLSRKQNQDQSQNQQLSLDQQYYIQQPQQSTQNQNLLQQAKKEQEHSSKTLRQNQENIQVLQNLVSQKTKIQNKIAQQRQKFDQLLNQIQVVANNKDKSVSASVDFQDAKMKQNKSEIVDIQLMNDRKKVNENQISLNMAYPQNNNANNSMHGVKLPQINNNSNINNLSNYNSFLNQENIPTQKTIQLNSKNRYYSTGNSAQKNYINELNVSQIQHSDQERQSISVKNPSIYNAIDKSNKANSRDISRRGGQQQIKSKENQSRISKEFSIMDQSITSIVDASFIKLNDSKQVKAEPNVSRKVRSFKSLYTNPQNSNNNQDQHQKNNTLEKQKSFVENNKLLQQKQSLENQKSDLQITQHLKQKYQYENNKTNSQNDQQTNQNGRNVLKNVSPFEPSPILKTVSPMMNQDLTGLSFIYSQDSQFNLQENSQILKQLQEQGFEMLNNNPSQSQLNESQLGKKKLRSKTLHDAEILLNRIKKRSVHYQEHQEQITNQIQNFNFDKIKQRQIKILQAFKDQKVPDIVKKRLHHDFIDILSMCKS